MRVRVVPLVHVTVVAADAEHRDRRVDVDLLGLRIGRCVLVGAVGDRPLLRSALPVSPVPVLAGHVLLLIGLLVRLVAVLGLRPRVGLVVLVNLAVVGPHAEDRDGSVHVGLLGLGLGVRVLLRPVGDRALLGRPLRAVALVAATFVAATLAPTWLVAVAPAVTLAVAPALVVATAVAVVMTLELGVL